MKACIRGAEIYFDIDGAGLVIEDGMVRERPTAFLIPGGPGSDHTGLKLRYGPLSEKMQLVYFDHRGHGRSARCNPKTYNIDENVEDMEALRRHLGLGPIVSIGTSYGGWVAQAHAARYPEAVSHLILIVTVAHSGNIERARAIVAERGTAEQLAMFDDLLEGWIDTADKYRRYLNVLGPLYSVKHDAHASAVANVMILEPEPLNRAMGPGGFLRSLDLRPELAKITAPTLILAGRHDWICPPEFSREIHELIPGSVLRVFQNSSHLIGVDEQEPLLEEIANFVASNVPKALP